MKPIYTSAAPLFDSASSLLGIRLPEFPIKRSPIKCSPMLIGNKNREDTFPLCSNIPPSTDHGLQFPQPPLFETKPRNMRRKLTLLATSKASWSAVRRT